MTAADRPSPEPSGPPDASQLSSSIWRPRFRYQLTEVGLSAPVVGILVAGLVRVATEEKEWKLLDSAGCGAKEHHLRAFDEMLAKGVHVEDRVFEKALGIDFDWRKYLTSDDIDQGPMPIRHEHDRDQDHDHSHDHHSHDHDHEEEYQVAS